MLRISGLVEVGFQGIGGRTQRGAERGHGDAGVRCRVHVAVVVPYTARPVGFQLERGPGVVSDAAQSGQRQAM